MIDKIKGFMAGCPLLSDIALQINYLGEDAVSGAVETVSAEPVIKSYTDGGTLRQYLFALTLRQNCGQDAAANIKAAQLLEQTSDWIREQDKIGMLPVLDGNKNAVSLEAIKTGGLEEKTDSTAKYQLQCRLIYYQD